MELSGSVGVLVRHAVRHLEETWALDTLQSCTDRATLKWWYKLATLPEDRYPKQLFNQEWNIKPRSGRQRKVWSKMVDDIFKSLGIDKGEWLEDIVHVDSL